MLPSGGTFGRGVAQGPERHGEAADVRGKRRRTPRPSLVSHVSSVLQTLMDKCGAERIPISFGSSKSGRRRNFDMLHTDALITKGCVRTLVRSFEESNGTEAWRLVWRRYPRDTQNREYALMQKEGFASCLRAREPDFGHWERALQEHLLQMQSSTQC